MPNDIDPEEPDGHDSAPIVSLPSAAQATPAAGVVPPRKPARTSTAKGKRTTARPKAVPKAVPPADPGPPPPLPADLEVAGLVATGIAIPPKPPLPDVADEADAADEADVAREADVAVEPDAAVSPVVEEPAAEPEVEEAVDAAPVVEEPAAAAAESTAVAAPDVQESEVAEPEAAQLESSDTPSEAAETSVGEEDVPEVLTAPVTDGDVLVLRGVAKRFGDTHAVEGIDLTVPAGTFYGLVGPNGAGKTTTLSMIAGLLVPDRGTIHVGGVDAASESVAAKRLMGVLPDRLRTFDRLTGRQLLYYYGVLRGLAPAIVESRTADLARAFDLTDALGRVVSDYSAGMTKKVMLAGALIHSPRLLVLDEPFEAVDPVSSAIILDILSTYVAHGGTVILSSHGMELVERVCSRVAVIVAGQVLAEGTIDEVRGELSLEQRFIELAGGLSDVEGLEWLHTFSD